MIFRLPTIPTMPKIPTLVGGDAGGGIDPALIVTNGGVDVTNVGETVTNGLEE